MLAADAANAAAAAAAAVVRPLCPHFHWVSCAPLTFCFSYAAVM